jgi:phosphomannomutase
VIEEVKAQLRKQGAKFDDIDGVRVQADDGWWLLRASNTQAILVARCEASSSASLERLKIAINRALETAGQAAVDWESS